MDSAPAPIPINPPRPFGDRTAAAAEHIVDAYRRNWPGLASANRQRNIVGLGHVLDHLSRFPGETWQQRWEAAGLNERHTPLGEVLITEIGPSTKNRRSEITAAMRILFCMRVIQPSIAGFRSNKFGGYPESFGLVQKDRLLDRFFAEVEARTHIPRRHRKHALFDVCCALTTQGIALSDLTPEALLHYAFENQRHGTAVCGKGLPGKLAWQVLHEMGHFPPSTPPTLGASLVVGQLSMAQLVDLYDVRDPDVRQLLIDYLTRRNTEADFNSITGIARALAGNFWATVESINPGQATLEIDQATYEQWRETINWQTPVAGKPPQLRKDVHGILLHVRALYGDIHSWAVEDPGTWAKWAAPCPIPYGELRGYNVRKRRVKERIDHRIRVRQPLLATLVEYVETQYEQARSLLAVGATVEPTLETAVRFVHAGREYERFTSRLDLQSPDHIPVRLRDLATGAVVNQTAHENSRFWHWAVVEVLRLSGIRIEELCELTHLSIRQYQRPSGEVIGLLVIAPSKSDRERVVPMSAELFHVIAQIIRRLTNDGRSIRLVARYDHHERVWGEPMPYLFQRQYGASQQVLSPVTILGWLKDTCAEIAALNPAFADMHFTPHDFRRLFATDLANSGLPIHIGAALLGHLNLETFRGYVTVFNEDIVRHYQAHLDRRRQLRPTEEYRPTTDTEWTEFQAHFDKRRVELGGCARPYGTGCKHEHACIRCPMLNVNPKMLSRLDDIETDLIDRRTRAEQEAWQGEIEGLDLTLTFLRQKRDQTQRLARLTPSEPILLTLEPPPRMPNSERQQHHPPEVNVE
ncbi:tyrosine-type recombinase/integrase [Nocardia fluminea]|uniref:tyrosine-type recombinase/integrase n=1 Tax=Nocardia fluminea TaxID=134984 RepID=UPI0036597A47